MLPAGHLIGPFQVLGPLGAGAMSLVFSARHTSSGARVALKILRPEHRLSTDLLSRFVNEALPIRDLRHPGLPLIFACEVPSDGHPYIAMELLSASLAEHLRRAPLPHAHALSIVAQIADALAAIHALGIVHRDVKPHNVLFSDAGQAKLVDFSLAKHPPDSPVLYLSTAEEDALGTPEYMAPEQAICAKHAEPSADVYSLGVLLYELLARRLPFQSPRRGRLRVHHLLADPPPLRDLPAPLWTLCAQMLHKDRTRRPTAADVAAVLRDLPP
jgi:serine/threonine protein kinase